MRSKHFTVYHTQTPGIFLRVEAGLDGGNIYEFDCAHSRTHACVLEVEDFDWRIVTSTMKSNADKIEKSFESC